MRLIFKIGIIIKYKIQSNGKVEIGKFIAGAFAGYADMPMLCTRTVTVCVYKNLNRIETFA